MLFSQLVHGLQVLLKDNIATMLEEGMNTTSGSWALYKSVVRGDAGVVMRLRKAGAIILGALLELVLPLSLSHYVLQVKLTCPNGLPFAVVFPPDGQDEVVSAPTHIFRVEILAVVRVVQRSQLLLASPQYRWAQKRMAASSVRVPTITWLGSNLALTSAAPLSSLALSDLVHLQ